MEDGLEPDMRRIAFARTNPPATVEQIKEFERRWELKLPPSFKEFCLIANGGRPESCNDTFPVEARFKKFHGEYNFGLVGVAWFEPLMGEKSSIDATMEMFVDRLSPNRVPIASEGCGNYITLSVAEEDFGAVYYWEHEFDEDYPIADDFESFLEGLTRMPENPGG